MNSEREALTIFRRALRKEDQLAFDELWVHIQKHLMTINQVNHLIPLDAFFLAMLLEEHKEIKGLQRMIEELQQ